jgi:hypothetical protein
VLQGVSARSPAYAAAVQRLVDGPFAPARMADQIRRHADFIASAVAADPIGAGDVAWRSAVAGLDRDLALLRRRAELFRDGQNVVPIAVVPQGVNDFEQADELGIIFGASSMSNPASSVRHVLNRSGALQGAQDLKIEFEYRNEPRPDGAWEQWTYFTVGFLGGPQDLRARTGLRMLVRADQTRRLRIELESPAHRAANEGIRLGWYATAGSGAAVVEVRFAEAGLPEWARATGDVLGDVLARSTGIALQAYVVGNGSDGFLPDGATDPGYLEIDALEVF